MAQIGIDVNETDRDKVKARIEEFIGTAFIALIRGDSERYGGFRLMAHDLRANYMEKIGGGASRDRIGLPPVEETEQEILKRMLDPNDEIYGLPPEARAILRTEMRMEPEAIAPVTNAPPASGNSPNTTTNAPTVVPKP
jgi:hypothetical protein